MPEITLRDHIDFRLNCICEEIALLRADVESLKMTRAELAGKASQQSVIAAYVISGVSLAISLLKLFGG